MKTFDYKYTALVREIAYCQFKLKDQSTLLGFLWSFLHPVLILFVFLAFFQAKIGHEIPHYGIFLLIGILHYTNFATSTAASMTSLTTMRQMTRNVILPKELIVLGSVVAFSIEFVLSMGICVGIGYLFGVPPSWKIVFIPVVFFLQILTITWISLLLSCLYVFIRDIAHFYQVFLRILLFATPVFYKASFLGKGGRYVVELNPLAQAIHFSRDLILNGTISQVGKFLTCMGINALLVVIFFLIFKKYEPLLSEKA